MAITLRFRKDGTLKIAQITDLHWQDGNEKDLKTNELTKSVLEWEDPDLVVLSGDVIEANGCTDPKRSWQRAVEPIEAKRKPWAAIFGNHDTEAKVSRAELMRLQQSYRRCLSRSGPAKLQKADRVGNYALKIRAARTDSTAAVLYFLDSGAGAPEGLGDYAWITHEQICWFRGVARRVQDGLAKGGGRRAPQPICSIVFLHIPFPEFDELWRTQTYYGHKGEDVCGPVLNSGFFAAVRELGGVSGIFIGHDHLNDYEGTLHGIRLVYGRVGGYNTYPEDGSFRGARMILLREGKADFETWLRLDDGTKVTDPPVHPPGSARSISVPRTKRRPRR